MSKELGKATIGDIVVDHRAVDEGNCDINVYKVTKSEDGPSGNGDSIWGYDPGCNCDMTSETSPAGQEGFLESYCHKLEQIKGRTTTQDSSQTTSETALATNYQPQEAYQAGMGGIAGAALIVGLAFGIFYKTVTMKGPGLKNKDKK